MQLGISSHLYLPQRLTPALLERFTAAGAQTIEIFAARHHFDYTDRAAARELANWFRSNPVSATLHMPLYPDAQWSRYTEPTLNLIAESKQARIDAQDEVKRALESAEQVPFRSCVIHLGLKDDRWDDRTLDASLTAIEHLKAFATPLGIQLLLENLPNDVAIPAHLAEIVRIGHFDNVGFCLDVGHAHLDPAIPETSHTPAKSGIEQAFDILGDRTAELHLHDNHGSRDEHCWPGAGTVDWEAVGELLANLTVQPAGILEIAHDLRDTPDSITEACTSAWNLLETPVAA